jgi:hypothetical protein
MIGASPIGLLKLINGGIKLGALEWAIDMGQSARISELQDVCDEQQKQIDELKRNVEMLSKWVLFLTTNGKEICLTTPNNV